MTQTEKNDASPVGLDIGTSRIVVARKPDKEFQYESQLNAFVNIPFSKVTESVLQGEKIPHRVEGSEIVVHGDEAERFADLLKTETRRPMIHGFLNPQESKSLERVVQLVGMLCGKAKKEGQLLYFSVAAPPVGEEDNLTYHEATLRRVLGALGYEAKSITEGLAVVYSELAQSNYTGIGVSCGGGLCNVCLAYLSVPVFSFSIPKAGDFIDASSAAVVGGLATSIRIIKEDSFSFNGTAADRIHQVIGVYYDDMIRTVLATLTDQLAQCRNLPRLGRPIPLVLSGGSSLPAGFRDRFEQLLKESGFPIALSEIRMADSPLHTVAKGALIAALIE